MYNPSAATPSATEKNNSKSMMFIANLDSLDSISELIRKVYVTVTPRCVKFGARFRTYGTRRRKNRAYFVTFPKNFVDYVFGLSEDVNTVMDRYDVSFFYDKNLMKKTDRNNREEMYVLMKLTKKLE